jgi:hypothetical protein
VIPLLPLLLLAAAETPFDPGVDRFADADACRARLGRLAAEARTQDYDAVEGPYEIAAGDTRIHMVRAEGNGHRIAEHRCLAATLGSRSWRHSMAADDEAFTVESVARTAPWLEKGGPEQQ